VTPENLVLSFHEIRSVLIPTEVPLVHYVILNWLSICARLLSVRIIGGLISGHKIIQETRPFRKETKLLFLL
jgi:hypothetical protein